MWRRSSNEFKSKNEKSEMKQWLWKSKWGSPFQLITKAHRKQWIIHHRRRLEKWTYPHQKNSKAIQLVHWKCKKENQRVYLTVKAKKFDFVIQTIFTLKPVKGEQCYKSNLKKRNESVRRMMGESKLFGKMKGGSIQKLIEFLPLKWLCVVHRRVLVCSQTIKLCFNS